MREATKQLSRKLVYLERKKMGGKKEISINGRKRKEAWKGGKKKLIEYEWKKNRRTRIEEQRKTRECKEEHRNERR